MYYILYDTDSKKLPSNQGGLCLDNVLAALVRLHNNTQK